MVAEACVFGIPDAGMCKVLQAAILQFARSVDRDELPRHETGKIYARHLREEWLARQRAR